MGPGVGRRRFVWRLFLGAIGLLRGVRGTEAAPGPPPGEETALPLWRRLREEHGFATADDALHDFRPLRPASPPGQEACISDCREGKCTSSCTEGCTSTCLRTGECMSTCEQGGCRTGCTTACTGCVSSCQGVSIKPIPIPKPIPGPRPGPSCALRN